MQHYYLSTLISTYSQETAQTDSFLQSIHAPVAAQTTQHNLSEHWIEGSNWIIANLANFVTLAR